MCALLFLKEQRNFYYKFTLRWTVEVLASFSQSIFIEIYIPAVVRDDNIKLLDLKSGENHL